MSNKVDFMSSGETLVASFRQLFNFCDVTKKSYLNKDMFQERSWLKEGDTIPILSYDMMHVFLHTDATRKDHFFVYDEMRDTIFFIGTTAREAAQMWNFPDLKSWQVVDDVSGDILNFGAYDAELNSVIHAEVVKELDMC